VLHTSCPGAGVPWGTTSTTQGGKKKGRNYQTAHKNGVEYGAKVEEKQNEKKRDLYPSAIRRGLKGLRGKLGGRALFGGGGMRDCKVGKKGEDSEGGGDE